MEAVNSIARPHRASPRLKVDEREIHIRPAARFDIVDLSSALSTLRRERRFLLLWSAHTTAGFLGRQALERLRACRSSPSAYVAEYRCRFPAGAGYQHDDLGRRTELSPLDRLVEPQNADAHLTFIAAGLETCVCIATRVDWPAIFIDLDGVGPGGPRRRTVRAIGYSQDRTVASCTVVAEPPDAGTLAVSLTSAAPDLQSWILRELARHRVGTGYVELTVDRSSDAWLTVNEYEPLLMHHDLRKALHDWSADRATRGLLRLHRSVRLLASADESSGRSSLVTGHYQSPVLVVPPWSPRPDVHLIGVSLHAIT